MAKERGGGGGFWSGLVIGGVVGYLIGSYLATDEGRERMEALRQRTTELTGDPDQLRERAAAAATTTRGAMQDAIAEGVTAARRRRQELGRQVRAVPRNKDEVTGDGGKKELDADG